MYCRAGCRFVKLYEVGKKRLVVAKGRLLDEKPNAKVSGEAVGQGFCLVQVVKALKRDYPLLKSRNPMFTIGDAEGKSVAWPRNLHQKQPLCHGDELSALLQFKDSLFISRYASGDPSAYPKVSSWKIEEQSRDCCLWDSVECDRVTGHVIGLNLNSSFLYGSINSSSSIFHLVNLQRLNLADNNFNYSQIPTSIGLLSNLTSLDLSASNFFGQIPSEILGLSKLTHLNLSMNGGYNAYGDSLNLLKLEKPNLGNLVQNLPNLEVLDLAVVNISFSPVPRTLSNMSSLTYLNLVHCDLYGEFPEDVFKLTNLRFVSLNYNPQLTGSLPDQFNNSSPLQTLQARQTAFSGHLPHSIGNLEELSVLILRGANFWGQLPSSIANLSRLTILSLGNNNFDVGILPFPLGLLSDLVFLELEASKVKGQIADFLSNLTQLTDLRLRGNELVGQIPPSIGNLTHLVNLDLYLNQLHGMIPSSVTQLSQLETIFASTYDSSGKVNIAILLMMLKNLNILQLGGFSLTGITKLTKKSTIAQLQVLVLIACNLREFPVLLQYQNQLQVLYLHDNNIEGEIPSWFWNTTKDNLQALDLSLNFLTGFEKNPDVLPWRSLEHLYLSSNKLQGPIPIPPQSTRVYLVDNNSLSGEIPDSLCHNSSLQILDLSDNDLSGRVNPCLLNSIESLEVLDASGNNFSGSIPRILTTKTNLGMIDLSRNRLIGKLPTSLAKCMALKALFLGNNQIEDIFPFWLGNLPNLEVLSLQSNKLYGVMEEPPVSYLGFPKMRIIDISRNAFHGVMCSKCIQRWNSMKEINAASPLDVSGNRVLDASTSNRAVFTYKYSVTLRVKGTERSYQIRNAFVVIDMSHNNFQGEFPVAIASLIGLQVLNISNNSLTGVIPASLANLSRMESLDLSQNNLSGEIPHQLNQLTFLAVMNLSGNHLTGPIPQGKQFDTFDNSSYGGNPGLCGLPLSKSCADPEASPPPPFNVHDDDEWKFPATVVDWIVISMGYAGGITFGVILGQILTTRYHEWFVYKFGRGKKTPRRQKRAVLRKNGQAVIVV